MSKYIPSWEFWDWNSILKSLLVMGLLVFVVLSMFNMPDKIRHLEEKKLDRVTMARVTSVKKYLSVGTRENSANIYLDGITIEYKYIVSGNEYSEFEVIPDNIHTRKYVHSMLNNPDCEIHVKYSSKNPCKSLIIIDTL